MAKNAAQMPVEGQEEENKRGGNTKNAVAAVKEAAVGAAGVT